MNLLPSFSSASFNWCIDAHALPTRPHLSCVSKDCRRSIRSCCFHTCFSSLIEVQLVSHFHFELFRGPGLQRDQLLDQLPQPLLNPSIKLPQIQVNLRR